MLPKGASRQSLRLEKICNTIVRNTRNMVGEMCTGIINGRTDEKLDILLFGDHIDLCLQIIPFHHVTRTLPHGARYGKWFVWLARPSQVQDSRAISVISVKAKVLTSHMIEPATCQKEIPCRHLT